MTKRVIVAGGRNFDNYQLLQSCLDYIFKDISPKVDIEIVSGHAEGADKLGEKYAKDHNLSLKVFPAEWEKYGKKAGSIRNSQMIDYAKEQIPMVVAFWNGKSRGTMDTLSKAQLNGIESIVILFNSEGDMLRSIRYDYGYIEENIGDNNPIDGQLKFDL